METDVTYSVCDTNACESQGSRVLQFSDAQNKVYTQYGAAKVTPSNCCEFSLLMHSLHLKKCIVHCAEGIFTF